ncbi:MAG: GNAT family N-acetyltransferase [Chloroflexota bacterium]
MVLRQVTTWYLSMPDPGRLRPKPLPRPDAHLARVELPCPEFNEFLYRTVGKDWYWIDRLPWTRDEWQTWTAGIETWVAYVAGTPAGYFELQARQDGTVHLVLFGLLPWAIGQGLGGWLLTQAIERAWALGPQTVTVNTCSLDGPHALANYQARGFGISRIVTSTVNLGDGA